MMEVNMSKPKLITIKEAKHLITTRAYKALRLLGVETLNDITLFSKQELLRVPNFGAFSLRRVRDVLAVYGLSLRGEAPCEPYATRFAREAEETETKKKAEEISVNQRIDQFHSQMATLGFKVAEQIYNNEQQDNRLDELTSAVSELQAAGVGVSLRDQFAMASLAGIITNHGIQSTKIAAMVAYDMADAMMAAREAK
jgi:hypothetical protein